MTDLRPEVQRGNVRAPDWIYFRAEGTAQSDLLVDYLGNALSALRATPGYVVLSEGEDSSARVEIDLEYVRGYSRWPVEVDQRGNSVAVEGAATVRYEITVDGSRVKRGTMKTSTADFLVPVEIIRQDNVRKVVSEALQYQFNKTTTDLLDEFLWRVADAWPTAY